MALSYDSAYWLPMDVIALIGGSLSLNDRNAYACTCKGMKNAMCGYITRMRGGVWTTPQQEELLASVVAAMKTSKLVHLNAPPSAGKTLISLWALYTHSAFHNRTTPLYIVTTSSTMGIWENDLKKVMPDAKVAKVCSGNGGYSVSQLRDVLVKDSNKIDVVILSPTTASYLLFSQIYTNPLSFDYMIFDEAHRKGKTELLINHLQRNEAFDQVIFLSANAINPHDIPLLGTVKNTITVVDGSNSIASHQLPTAIDHYVAAPLEIYGYAVEVRCDKVSDYYSEVAKWCISKCAHPATTNRIVVFVGWFFTIGGKQSYISLNNEWTLYTTRAGAKRSQSIQDFNEAKGKSIILMPYKSCATSFSIDANEVFLFTYSGCGTASLYQARRRVLRITSVNTSVDVHYVGESVSQARVHHAIAEKSVEKAVTLSSLYVYRVGQGLFYTSRDHTSSLLIYSKVALLFGVKTADMTPMPHVEAIARALGIDLITCDISILLYLLHPADKCEVIREMRGESIPALLLKYKKEIRSCY